MRDSATRTPGKADPPSIADSRTESILPVSFSVRSVCGVVVVVTLLCYANSLTGDFVHDDTAAVVDNKDVDPDRSAWSSLFFNDFWGEPIRSPNSHKSYRPLTVATFRINRILHGKSTLGYHLVNVLLQCGVCVLFVRVCEQIFGPAHRDVTTICSLLFATHPIHVEAVANITGRAEMLSALFFLLAFLKFNSLIMSVEVFTWTTKAQRLISCALLSAAAMFSKESGLMVLPLCAAYYVFVKLNLSIPELLRIITTKEWRGVIGLPLALVGMASVLFAFRVWIMGLAPPNFGLGDNPASFANGLLTRVLTYSYTYTISAWLLLVPQMLCVDWQTSSLPLIESFADSRFFHIVLFYGAFAYIAGIALWKQPTSMLRSAVVAGFLFLVIPFIPASNLLFRVGFVVADRVLYLPSMGFCMLIAAAASKAAGGSSARKQLVRAGLCVIIALYTSKTVMRNGDWLSAESLYRSGFETNPLCSKCHFGYAEDIRLTKAHIPEKLNEAAAHLRTSLALWSHSTAGAGTHNALGMIVKLQGNIAEAEHHYKAAVETSNLEYNAFANLGNLYKDQKKYELSIENYRRAIRIRPKNPDYHSWLGHVLELSGDLPGALASSQTSLAILHSQAIVHLQSARLMIKLGRPRKELLDHFDTALTLYPIDSHERIAVLLEKASYFIETGDVTNGEPLLQSVLHDTRTKQSVPAQIQCAVLMRNLSRIDESLGLLRSILIATPANARVHREVALTLRERDSQAGDEYLLAQVDKHPTTDMILSLVSYFETTLRAKSALTYLLAIVDPPSAQFDDQQRGQFLQVLMKLHKQHDPQNTTVAQRIYSRLLEVEPNQPDISFELGNIYKQQKQYKLAINAYESALANISANFQAYFVLAEAYELDQNYDEAIAKFKLGLSLPGGARFPKVNQRLGKLLTERELFDEALYHFDQELATLGYAGSTKQTAAVDAVLTDKLAVLLTRRSRTEEANAFVASLDLETRIRLGLLLKRQKRNILAVSLFTLMLELTPRHPQACLELARLKSEEAGKFESSREIFDQALNGSSGTNELELRALYAAYLVETKQQALAVGVLAPVVDLVQQSRIKAKDKAIAARLLIQLSGIQTDIKDERASEHTLTLLLGFDPSNVDGHYSMANLVRTRDWKLAENHYIQAIQYAPKPTAILHGNLGALYHLHKVLDKAVEQYEKALQIEPQNSLTQENLSKLKSSKAYQSLLSKE